MNKLKLIEGNFTKEESMELLMGIYTSKIKFHDLKIFSSEERFGYKDKKSVEKIPELIEAKNRAQEIISTSSSSNFKIISSIIIIDSEDSEGDELSNLTREELISRILELESQINKR